MILQRLTTSIGAMRHELDSHYRQYIHPIHVAAMLNKKRGLEGKFVKVRKT